MRTSVYVHHWEQREEGETQRERGDRREKWGIEEGARQHGEEDAEGVWGMEQGVEGRGLRKEAPELEEGLGGGRQRSGCHPGRGSEEEGV